MKSIMIETWNHFQTWKWTFLKRYIVSRRIHIGSTFFGALFFQYLIPISNGIILLLDSQYVLVNKNWARVKQLVIKFSSIYSGIKVTDLMLVIEETCIAQSLDFYRILRSYILGKKQKESLMVQITNVDYLQKVREPF